VNESAPDSVDTPDRKKVRQESVMEKRRRRSLSKTYKADVVEFLE